MYPSVLTRSRRTTLVVTLAAAAIHVSISSGQALVRDFIDPYNKPTVLGRTRRQHVDDIRLACR